MEAATVKVELNRTTKKSKKATCSCIDDDAEGDILLHSDVNLPLMKHLARTEYAGFEEKFLKSFFKT